MVTISCDDSIYHHVKEGPAPVWNETFTVPSRTSAFLT